MNQYTINHYSVTAAIFRKLHIPYEADHGCLFYAALAILNFWAFGVFFGSITFTIGFLLLLLARTLHNEDSQAAFEQAVKEIALVPIQAMHYTEDSEGGRSYSLVVMHPVAGTRWHFSVDDWVYTQLETGDLVTFVYAPEVPDYYQILVDRHTPAIPMDSCPSPSKAIDDQPKASANKYYQQESEAQDAAQLLTWMFITALLVMPFVLVAVGIGWGCFLLFPVCFLTYSWLEKWIYRWQKKRFEQAEKVTQPALVKSKHQGQGGKQHYVVLLHPVNGQAITFPIDTATFKNVGVGQTLPFTYSPEKPGQYCLAFDNAEFQI